MICFDINKLKLIILNMAKMNPTIRETEFALLSPPAGDKQGVEIR